jgi:subtilisin family serine protease/uncharacterized membrane protein
MRGRLLCVVVSAALLVISLAGHDVSSEPSVVSGALQARASALGVVRVIVTLNAPFIPEEHLATPAHVLGQRQMLAGVQSTVRGQLQGVVHRMVRDFAGTLPLMALEASPDALRMLASLRGIVADVQEDVPAPPALAGSIPVINASEVWSAGYDGAEQIVAILDTGVQKTHPFLGGRVIAEACFSSTFTPDGATSLCPGGAETSLAPNSALPCEVPGADCKHGTHVAGIAAGSGASFSGVARGASIIAIQVFSRFPASHPLCGGTACVLTYSSDQIAALNYVHAQRQVFPGRRIAAANMSLGGGRFTSPCLADVRRPVIDQLRAPHPSDPTDPGVATVVSTGNDGYTNGVGAPACNPSAIPVASSTKSDAVSGFSNIASTQSFPNLLIAPGSSITSSVPPSTFAIFNGTSMAAPHVTGALAVLRQLTPTATVDELITQLKTTGTLIADTRPGASATAPRIDLLAAALEVSAPNLVVHRLTAPAAAVPGNTLSVTTSIRNTSAGPAAASSLKLYLSTDAVITASDSLLGSVAFGQLDGGATSSTQTVSVRVPLSATAGSYHVGAIADADGQVEETDETDNTKAVAIRLALPDLTVPSVTFTSAATAPGASIGVTHTIRNVGPAPANAPVSTSAIYLSRNQSFASRLGGPLAVVSAPAVAAGATSPAVRTTKVTIPSGTPRGLYYVLVRANDTSAFAEGLTTNNVGASATAIVLGSDLVPTAATVSPALTAPGKRVSVGNTIRNQGGQAAGPFEVGVYLSTNATYDAGVDTLLGSRRVTGLAPAAVSTATTAVEVPANVAAGTYFLIVRADTTGSAPQEVGEADEGNNTRATAAMRVVRPDLTVLSVRAPGIMAPGQNVGVSHVVKNLAAVVGGAAASTSRLYLSTDATLHEGSDRVLGDMTVNALTGGAQAAVTRTVTIPATTAPGRYWLIAQANATDVVEEADAPGQANNWKATATPVIVGRDLIPTLATATPRSTAPGKTLSVQSSVKNQGGQGAGPFNVAIYLSTDTGYEVGVDRLLSSRAVAGLAAGATSTATTPVTIPADTSPGTYFLLVVADSGGAVAEANNGNNVLATAAVQVVRPDLTVLSVTSPAAMAPGQNVSVSHVVRNLSAPVGGAAATTSRLYLSTDATLHEGSDWPLGDVTVNALAGGAQATVTRTVTIPATTAPGRYWLIAQANATDMVEEADAPGQANNWKARATPVIIGPDLVVTTAVGSRLTGPGVAIPVTTTIRNQGGGVSSPTVVVFVLAQAGRPDVSLSANRAVPALAPGAASGPVATIVTIPSGTPAGVYFIKVQADGPDTLEEADETNNDRATASLEVRLPNVTIVSITPPAAVIRGRATGAPNASIVVKNTGPGPTARFNVKVFAARADGTPDADVPGSGDLLFTRTVAALGPGATTTLTGPIVVPEVVGLDVRLAGNYFVSALADPTGAATGDASLADNVLLAPRRLPVVPDMTKLRSAMVDLNRQPACPISGNVLRLQGPFMVTSQSVASPSSFAATATLSDGAAPGVTYRISGKVWAVDPFATAGGIAATFTYAGVGTRGSGTMNGAAPGLDFPDGTLSGVESGLPACNFSGTINVER